MDWRLRRFGVNAVLALLLAMALAGCGADGDDQAVIDQLRAAGADLSQPREVRYYLARAVEPFVGVYDGWEAAAVP